MSQESLNRITTGIASHFNRESDEPFKRILAVKVDYWRSTLVQRSLEKHPEQRKFFRQTLWVPMETVSSVPLKLPFTPSVLSQSVTTIPSPIRHRDELFDFVGDVEGTTPFRPAVIGTTDYLQAGKYSKKAVFYRYEEDMIRIKSNSLIPVVRVDGVFDKPLDVMKFNCNCSNTDCDYWNKPYPITGDILQMVVQYILEVDYQRVAAKEPIETEVNQAQNAA